MDILKVHKASDFHGQYAKTGYIIYCQSTEEHMSSLFGVIMPKYMQCYSWPIYRTKSQAQDVCKLVVLLAVKNMLGFKYTLYNTRIDTWFERDRSHVALYFGDTLLMEFWDEEVYDMVECGLITPKDYHGSMLQYFNSL